MYSGEGGEVYVELGYLGKVVPSPVLAQPDKSKAGGLPAWFGEAPVNVDDLVCRLCGRELFLVVQVYAPTRVERSLCIFGCNRAPCSVHSQGWRVIRTQKLQENRKDTASNCAEAQNIISSTIVESPVTSTRSIKPADDAWGTDTESWGAPVGDDWGADAGDWEGEAGGKDEVTAAVIDALLEEREMTSAERFSDRAKHTTAPDTAPAMHNRLIVIEQDKCNIMNSDSNRPMRRCFPAKPMNFSPEPWGPKGSDTDKDMKERIQRYREKEEDRGLIAELDRALGRGTGDEYNSQVRSQGAKAADVGEKYERTPQRAKAIMRFAERVARAPQQVLRYAYEGEPIWSASDPPREVVPPCPCGATRVFEMQLMPALLLQLRVNDFAERETTGGIDDDSACAASEASSVTARDKGSLGPTGQDRKERGHSGRSDIAHGNCDEGPDFRPVPSGEERERLRTWGMDWGVVAVWSCPRSCEASCEELAVVQLPV